MRMLTALGNLRSADRNQLDPYPRTHLDQNRGIKLRRLNKLQCIALERHFTKLEQIPIPWQAWVVLFYIAKPDNDIDFWRRKQSRLSRFSPAQNANSSSTCIPWFFNPEYIPTSQRYRLAWAASCQQEPPFGGTPLLLRMVSHVALQSRHPRTSGDRSMSRLLQIEVAHLNAPLDHSESAFDHKRLFRKGNIGLKYVIKRLRKE